MENQPKPEFTLKDLYDKLADLDTVINPEARLIVRELMTAVRKKQEDYEPINPSQEPTKEQKIIAQALGQDSKPMFHVAGVQLIENGRMQGTALYSTMPKAKKISSILNAKFAELRVDHEAKIQMYPVF